MHSSGGKVICENESLPTQENLSNFCKSILRVDITRLNAQGVTAGAFWEVVV